MRSRAMKVPGLLAVAGGLIGGLWGGARPSRGSFAFGVALGALSGAAGELMYNLRYKKLEEDRITVSEMAEYLCQHLSPEVTAYLSGLDEPDTVQAWAEGNLLPDSEETSRLEVAYKATQCLVEVCGDDMIRTWFFGTNRTLQNRAPAYALRHWRPEDRIFVLSAAEQFAEI